MSFPPFRFLHAADLHLDSPLRGLAQRGEAATAFVEASRRALENLVSAAIDENVTFLIVAGDIYDGDWRDYSTGQFFVRQMGRLARAGIRVFLISGNHDAASVISKNLPLPENVHTFSTRKVETVRIEELRVALHGRGFGNRHVEENVALTYPPAVGGHVNIGLLHTSLTGREGHDVYAPCSVEDLRRAGYDYWALGHIHRREVVAQDPLVVFPGNLQGRHARETGPKGATLVTVTDGRIAAAEALALDAVRFEHARLDLSGIDDMPRFRQEVRRTIADAHDSAQGRPLALRLTLSGETALHDHLAAGIGRIEEEVQALGWEAAADLLVEKVRLATTPPRRGGAPIIAGIDDTLAATAADPGFRSEIAAMLADLRARMPAESLELLGWTDTDPDAAATQAIAVAEQAVTGALRDAVPDAEPEDAP